MTDATTTSRTKPPGVLGSSLWALSDRWAQQLCQLAGFLVIGRLIGPEAFGVVSLALVYVLFVQCFLLDGFNEAVVQRAELDEQHIASSFWLLALLGLVAALLSLALAPLVAAAFGQPDLTDPIRWLALAFLPTGPSAMLEAVARRRLAYRLLALRSVVAYGTSWGLAIVLALNGWGLWSLVVNQIVLRAVELAVLAGASGGVPRPRLSLRHLRELGRFAADSIGLRLSGFVINQIERILVGWGLGAQAVGLYGMGRRMVDSLVFGLSGVFNNVAFSVLSRLQGEERRLIDAVYRAAQAVSLVIFPALIGLALVAPPLIEVLLGEAWVPMVPVIQILALSGIAASGNALLMTALRARGASGLVLRVNGVTALVKTVACAAMLPFGMQAVALADLATNLLAALPMWILWANRTIALGPGSFLRQWVPAAASSLVMWGGVALTGVLVAGKVPSAVGLPLLIAGGAVTYALAAAAFARPLLLSLLRKGVKKPDAFEAPPASTM